LMGILDGDISWDITNIINGFCGNWWRGSCSLQRTWCCQGLILHICLAPHKTCWNIETIRVLSLWDSNVGVIHRGKSTKSRSVLNHLILINHDKLLGGWATPLKNMKVSWDYYSHILPYIMENKTCSKPPTSSFLLID
jgi:hypothetical protein